MTNEKAIESYIENLDDIKISRGYKDVNNLSTKGSSIILNFFVIESSP